MDFRVETARQEDGRWMAEIPQLSGVFAFGASAAAAATAVKVLALRVLADLIERGDQIDAITFVHTGRRESLATD